MLPFQRFWTWSGRLSRAVLAVSLLASCGPERTGEVEKVGPELKLEGVTFRVWRGAELRVQGEAAQATLRRDSTELLAQDVMATLPRPHPVHLAAREGAGVLETQIFEARGGVRLTRDRDVVTTERARYEPLPAGGARVTGDAPVEVDGPAYRLVGQGFTLDPETGDLRLGGPSRLTARPEASR